MIKAVIYDLDDLMVKSDHLHFKAWDTILKEFNSSLNNLPKGYLAKFIGRRVVDTAVELVKDLKLNTTIDSFFKRRNEIFMRLVKNELESMPGFLYSLKLLKGNGYKIAIATSATKEYMDLVLKKFRIKKYFDVTVCGDEVKIGKPHPQTYMIACKKLGFKTKECLVLEDATNGIESAKAAGCKCIAIKNPYTPLQDHSQADIVLDSLKDLNLDIIRSLED